MSAVRLGKFGAGLLRRLAIVNVVALLPLAMLAGLQTRDLVGEASDSLSRAAMARTVQAAQQEIKLIGTAQTLARTLGAMMPRVLDDAPTCIRMMDDAASAYPEFSLIAYISLSGQMECASGGRTHDFSGNPFFARLAEKSDPRLVLNPSGPVSGYAVLGASHPVFSPGGNQIGLVAISVPHQAIVAPSVSARDTLKETPVALITFDKDGTILTHSVDLDVASALLPAGGSLAALARTGAQTFADHSSGGHHRIFSVAPITSELFLLGVWSPANQNTFIDPSIASWLLAGLLILSGLLAAAFAAERLVIRHVRSLSRAMSAFAAGARNLPHPDLDDPPAEIAELSHVYAAMTDTILRDEAELENLLHQKAELLREVHHRTGNSLQLIASILRMHLRENPDDTVRQVLEHLLERVMSLSTVHLGLYRIAGSPEVEVGALIGDVIAKVEGLHSRSGRTTMIEQDLRPLPLTTEQAVPLALLLAEVMAAFLASAAGDEALRIRVHLDTDSNRNAVLSVSGPPSARVRLTGTGGGAPDVIASRLIRSFVRQLDGDADFSEDGELLGFQVAFTIRQGSRNPESTDEGG
ncbi:Two-component sensor histidine kinase, contains HisKA and HATPase domains [Gemmobacter megaterium]|uniref:histidine kinase n=1 Tax=Gemmobacter megaterium TaxID=1086013 RepID=A0A1N7Q6G2_9RHOB|nr:sensor histidine kinase [Gemmobacter megaterium]GGE23493.1 histidine kinase [Gemmobacter megaterium]SIT18421.1 Two-component sensor histidine kinase, contains HisKA and HATPase domains [Gemmobacter megaterium]